MKYWSHEELHEVEEELLSRKEILKHLPEKTLTKIEWGYKDWEKDVIEQSAMFGYSVESIAKFLNRSSTDILHYIRSIGYENWIAYCEVVQGVSRKDIVRKKNISYREIVEAAIGRPLTKEEHIHHVNCDHYDDTLNNLWVCNSANHKHAHASYRKLQKALIAHGVIVFNRDTGDYSLNPNARHLHESLPERLIRDTSAYQEHPDKTHNHRHEYAQRDDASRGETTLRKVWSGKQVAPGGGQQKAPINAKSRLHAQYTPFCAAVASFLGVRQPLVAKRKTAAPLLHWQPSWAFHFLSRGAAFVQGCQ